MSSTKYLKVITNRDKNLCAVIYERNNQYIACEVQSSMGFTSPESAENWIMTVCKGLPLEISKSMLPLEIRNEVMEVMKQI